MNLNRVLRRLVLGTMILAFRTGAWGYTAADYTHAGLQLYAAKNYTQAIPYFTAALGLDPTDAKALQGRANSYYFLGRTTEALSDYEKILSSNPTGPVSQFVQALRAKMGPAAVPLATPADPGLSLAAAGPASQVKPAGLGLRLAPAYGWVKLADFTADSETGKKSAAAAKLMDPSFQYNSSVPDGYVMVGLEPVAQIGSNFELGLPFAIMPVGSVRNSDYSDAGGGTSDTVSYAISAFSVGLTGRFLLGQGPVRPFIGVGGLLVPIGINYTFGLSGSVGSGTFSQTAFGGQGQLGFDFHVGEPFVVSLFGAYVAASANGFKGDLVTSGTGSGAKDSGQLGVFESPNGKKIVFWKEGDPEPPQFRPLQVDLGGITAGIHLALFF